MSPAGQQTQRVLRVSECSPESPRARMVRSGADSLTIAELLTLTYDSSGESLDKTREILRRTDGDLRRLSHLSIETLTNTLTPAQALRVHAALALGRRMQDQFRPENIPFRSPRDVFAHYSGMLADLPHEELHVAILDSQHRLDRDVLVTRGLLSTSLSHPREVFVEAIASRAAAIVLVHNHPSGDPTPSPDDRAVTEQLVSAGRLLDIPVHDHIIIGRGRFMSFAEAGLL